VDLEKKAVEMKTCFKNLLCCIVAILFISLTVSCCSIHTNPNKLFPDRFLSKVYSISVSPDGTRSLSEGSGFFVKHKGRYFFITAAHVIYATHGIKVEIEREYCLEPEIPALLIPNYHDVAILPLKKRPNRCSILELEPETPQKGENITSYGFTSDNKTTTTIKGIYLHKDEMFYFGKPVSLHALNVRLKKGMSGGPTLNKEGKVIGVNSMIAQLDPLNRSYLVPSSYICRYLESICN